MLVTCCHQGHVRQRRNNQVGIRVLRQARPRRYRHASTAQVKSIHRANLGHYQRDVRAVTGAR